MQRRTDLPEDSMVILWILGGSPGGSAHQAFVEWAWDYYFQSKALNGFGPLTGKEFAMGMYPHHFAQWSDSPIDENGKHSYSPHA